MAVCEREVHEAMKLDDARWYGETTYLGVQPGCGGPDLEIRNCRCGSTLAREARAVEVAHAA